MDIAGSDNSPLGRRLEGLLLAIVLSACLGQRVWLVATTCAIAQDGTMMIRAARAWDADAGAAVDNRHLPVHPGYPVAVVGLRRAAVAAGAPDTLRTWELSGQGVSVAFGMAATLAMWWFARTAFADRRVALVATLLYGVARPWATLNADVLNDAPAACLQLWAIVLAVAAARRRGRAAILAAAGAGVLAGGAYLIRPEGGFILVVVISVWAVAAIRRELASRALAVRAIVATVCALAASARYALAIGTFTRKWPIEDFFTSSGSGSMLAAGGSSIAGSLWQIVTGLVAVMHPLLGMAMGLWVLVVAARAVAPRLKIVPLASPRRDCATAAGAWLLVFVPMIAIRTVRFEMSSRYLLTGALLLVPTAAAMLLALGDIITWAAARAAGCGRRFRGVLLTTMALSLAALLLGHAWRPLHADSAHLREAGLWLKGDVPAARRLMTTSPRVLHYAQLDGGVLVQEMLIDRATFRKALTGPPADYVAVTPRGLSALNPQSGSWLRELGLREIRRFPARRTKDTLIIYMSESASPQMDPAAPPD